MFADDTKIWAKIKDTGDSDLLQQSAGSEHVYGVVEAVATCL